MKHTMIITGTRKGIGRAMAEHFLNSGWQVAGCSRKPSNLEHENYRHFELDVSDERAVSEMVRSVSRESGSLDAVLNNAGIAAMNHLLLTPGKTVEKVLSTNVAGTFFFMREAGKVMSRKKKGCIVNFSTVAVPLNLDGEASYAASKAAVESLTKIGAKELGDFGVRVNAIGPTPVYTDLIKLVPEEKINELINRQAIKRLGNFRDILNVVEFYLSEASDFITGQIVYLGGVNA